MTNGYALSEILSLAISGRTASIGAFMFGAILNSPRFPGFLPIKFEDIGFVQLTDSTIYPLPV